MGYICHNVFVAAFPSEAAAESARKALAKSAPFRGFLSRVGSCLALGSDGSKEGWETSAEGDARRKALGEALEIHEVPWVDFFVGGESGEEGPDPDNLRRGGSCGKTALSDRSAWPREGFSALAIAVVGMDFPADLRSQDPLFRESAPDISAVAAELQKRYPGQAALLPGVSNGYDTALLFLSSPSRAEALSAIAETVGLVGDSHFCAMALTGSDWSVAAGSNSLAPAEGGFGLNPLLSLQADSQAAALEEALPEDAPSAVRHSL